MSKIPDGILRLTDDQLRQESMKHSIPTGPITDTTRKLYQKNLAKFWTEGGGAKRTPTKAPTPRKSSPKKQSIAAMSSEEEEEEEVVVIPPTRPTRHATPPVTRKSCTF